MNKLKKELRKINKELAFITLESMGRNQTKWEIKLWAEKRKILAKLNPYNV